MSTLRPRRGERSVRPLRQPMTPEIGASAEERDPRAAVRRPHEATRSAHPRAVPRQPGRPQRRRAVFVRVELIETPDKDYLVLSLRGTAPPPMARPDLAGTRVSRSEASWVLISGTPGSLVGVAYPAACGVLDRFLGRW